MDSIERYRQVLLRNRKLIWAVCVRSARGDVELTKDLIQEVMMQVLLGIDNLRENASVIEERNWMRWRCRAAIKRHRRNHRIPFLQLDTEALSATEDDDGSKELLEEALSYLTDDERLLFRLELDGYQGAEIAAQLGITVSAYYQRRHRAIEKLRKIYA